MTDDDVVKFYEDLVEYYGDTLVNFEQHPIQFAYQVKMYRYYKTKDETKPENENSDLQRSAP